MVFTVKNVGGATVRPKNLRQSCGCSPATITWSEIAPGETQEVRVVYKAPQFIGTVNNAVYLQTDAPGDPEIKLSFRARVAWALEASPPALDLGQVLPGSSLDREVKLLAADGRPFEVLGVAAPDGVTAVAVAGTGGGVCHRFKVGITAPLKPGEMGGVVRFTTNHPGRPVVEVGVAGTVSRAGRCVPPVLMLSGRSGADLKAAVTVAVDGLDMKATGGVTLSLDGDAWAVLSQSAQRADQGGVRVTLTLRGPRAPGLHSTALHIRIAGGQQFDVPVNCYVSN